jgi:hypothetical protein
MNWKLLFLALLAPLAACDWGQQPAQPPHRPPPPVTRPIDRGPDWLAAVPYCEGALRRGQWLVCDNKGLNWLHRTLANQWAEDRQGATRQQLWVQRQQLQALASERDACETAECVATAYRRYLRKPDRWVPEPGGWNPPPRPRPSPVHHRPPAPKYNWRDNGATCASKFGWQQAALLARQCSVVNPDGQCGPQRSCGALKTMILDGCWDMGDRKPGFCGRV